MQPRHVRGGAGHAGGRGLAAAALAMAAQGDLRLGVALPGRSVVSECDQHQAL